MNPFTILILIIPILFSSCSSLNKSRLYGSLSGSAIGALIGPAIAEKTSPNQESLKTNQSIGLASGIIIGAIGGALIADYFYKDDPENRQGPPLFENGIEKKLPPTPSTVPLNNLTFKSLGLPNTNIYQIPTSKDLPENLKNLIQKQILIEHQIPTQLIQQPDGSTLIINGTTATEHRYINP